MKRIFLALITITLLLAFAAVAQAQDTTTPVISSTSDPSACSAGKLYINTNSPGKVWARIAGGCVRVDGIGAGTGSVTNFSAGDLAPLFTTTEATTTTTPALSFVLSNAAAHTFFGNNTAGSAAPGFQAIGNSDLPSAIDAAKIADGTVSSTKFQFINSLTSNAQTQIDGKQASLGYTPLNPANNLSEVTAATARTNLGGTTVGANLFISSNPSAISFPKVAADNSVSYRTPAQVLSDIGAQAGPLTGDATTSGAAVTLKNTGTANTYRSVTFDAQGRETSGTNPTTFSGYGLSDTSANLRAALTDENGTGVDLFDSSTGATLATPVINGLPTGTGVAAAGTASTLAARDANANLTANNWLGGYATTTTAAGTTTLTVGSTYVQFFTGSTTQTVTLPVASTLTLGHQFVVNNNSTGAVTVNSSGSNAVVVVNGGTAAILTCILTSGTTAASWSASYSGAAVATGKKLTVNNSLTINSTDGITETTPTTSFTTARTDAANTFTGHQTIEGVTSTGGTGTGKFVFDTTPTFTTSIKTPMITPTADSTTAFRLTQADGSTNVVVVDTTNKRLGVNATPLNALWVSTGVADQNFYVNIKTALSTGVVLGASNDAGNAGVGMEIRVSQFQLTTSGTSAMAVSATQGVTWSTGLTNAAGTPGSLCYNTATFEMTKNNALTCTVSSRDFKQDIFSLPATSAFDKLRPVQFAYRDKTTRQRWGFIAEEAAAADPKLGDAYDAQGIARSLDQNAILALTVKEVQELKKTVQELKERP